MPTMSDAIWERHEWYERHHWWLQIRFAVARNALADLHLPAGSRILEIGSGGSTFAASLQNDGYDVTVADNDPRALRMAKEKGIRHIIALDGPNAVKNSIPSQSFDVIVALEVFEHIEEDKTFIYEVSQALRPGGKLILTVPAHQWLYGKEDAAAGHCRRYSKRRLIEALSSSFNIEHVSFFLILLFPLFAAFRLFSNLLPTRITSDGDALKAGRPLWGLFSAITALELPVIRSLGLPWGWSLMAVARKK